jgi:uncharacterized protein YbjQ (UPF0145 family)
MSTCVECGVALGGLTGAAEASDSQMERLREWEVSVPAPLCSNCFGRILEEAQARLGPALGFPDEPPEDFQAKVQERRRAVQLFTGAPFEGQGPLVNLGLVTAHAVIGTGPLATLASALSDVAGKHSKVYAEKLEEAESLCLAQIRAKADQLGALLVANIQASYSELTHGHGMLLVTMVGTAAKPAGQGEPGRS